MMILSERIVSVTQANRSFNKVAETATKYGDAVIFKRNKPVFILVDLNAMGEDFVKEYERLKMKHMSANVLEEYKEAYVALAK